MTAKKRELPDFDKLRSKELIMKKGQSRIVPDCTSDQEGHDIKDVNVVLPINRRCTVRGADDQFLHQDRLG